jgi:signal transduction histidine kinase
VGLIPERAFVRMVQSALESSRAMVPAYAMALVTVLGRPMTKVPADSKTVLASATAELGTLDALRLPLDVGLYWLEVDLLFRDQARRERWIAGFIGLAVLAAVVGVLQAWRTLRQQMALHEAKSNFVSAVSHELRAPLASVRLLAEGLARDGLADAAKRQEYGRFLVDETRRLGTLIENVLSLGRLEQGRRPLEIAPTDVHRLVHETVRRFEPLAAERGLVLEVDDRAGAEPLEAAWDGLAIQQALANLLDNALKHGPEGSHIQVTLERIPDTASPRIALAVRDQGPGIPEEDHERIFDRFYRRGSELRRETRGVGLGLALVREIAMAHGGRVWVASQPGHGAVFRLELPVGDPTA